MREVWYRGLQRQQQPQSLCLFWSELSGNGSNPCKGLADLDEVKVEATTLFSSLRTKFQAVS